MSVKVKLIVLSTLMYSLSVYAEPRSYPDEVFDDLELYLDIISAFEANIDVSNPDILAREFPGRRFEDFDRNRSGTFEFSLDADPLDLASTDVELAITQFNHDAVDYDGDGLTGFVELECEFSARADNTLPVILDPTLVSSDNLLPDGDRDCDGDSVSNRLESLVGFDPLDPIDMTLDYDDDQLTNAQEVLLGTDPYAEDTDGDGFTDTEEIGDPETPIDADQNGIIDALESYWLGVSAVGLQFVVGAAYHSNEEYSLQSQMVSSTESSSSAYTLRAEVTP